MRIYERHPWHLDYADARALQTELQKSVSLEPLALGRVRFVAGTDIAVDKPGNRLVAAVVVHEFPGMAIAETHTAVTELAFPYIPGLLSFREIPALAAVLRKVVSPVDVVLCDGQGIAHPRGVGLASHLGLILRKPTIGCAKSRLVGEHDEVGPDRGDFTELRYRGRRVGSVLRTRGGVKPLYVSPGHLVDQAGSRRLVLACVTKYRLPEPIRNADRLAARARREVTRGF